MSVARHLRAMATLRPHAVAIAAPAGGGWTRRTFAELDRDSDAVAAGLAAAGLERGQTTLVMVRAGVELITLTYALFKHGAIPVLIDPGMGRQAFLRAVAGAEATALVGIPLAHGLRLAFPAAFRGVRTLVTVGRRWLWGGSTLAGMLRAGAAWSQPDPGDDERAAILFTSGSTGPAKGVVYTHGMFEAQRRMLLDLYGFEPGEIDLAAFPLFSLFDAALGMTSVIPDLDPSRPGTCDPARVVHALLAHRATTAFGSPAVWRRVAPWCRAHGQRLPGVRRILVAGASVPPSLLADLHALLDPGADVFTPYGASEALPVASIGGREVVAETAALSREGAGTCVGRPVSGTDVRIIGITDEPIPAWSDELEVAPGAVGEICVRGSVVTREYHLLPAATASAKIRDGSAIWHRMGDLGYLDGQGRLWFCGRKAERVETADGPLYTDRVEGLAGRHPALPRVALVGVGRRGAERPVLVVEGAADPDLARALREIAPVQDVLFHPHFPVDVRHNAKIHRLTLKAWAEDQLR